jgi:hypothetical protein
MNQDAIVLREEDEQTTNGRGLFWQGLKQTRPGMSQRRVYAMLYDSGILRVRGFYSVY